MQNKISDDTTLLADASINSTPSLILLDYPQRHVIFEYDSPESFESDSELNVTPFVHTEKFKNICNKFPVWIENCEQNKKGKRKRHHSNSGSDIAVETSVTNTRANTGSWIKKIMCWRCT